MILYAINISTGGGKVLLDEVLLKQPLGKPNVIFLDERYPLPLSEKLAKVSIIKVKPKLLKRLLCEFRLRKTSSQHPNEEVICFGNLPPAFRLSSKTIVYLQNAYLLDSVPFPKDSLKLFLRNSYERLWFKLFIRNADEVWVQTSWMKNSLPEKLKTKALIKPIFPTMPVISAPVQKSIDFISITGTIKYKNLIPLLEGILDSGVTNKKFVIISDYSSNKIESLLSEIKNNNIDLEFLTNLSREEVFNKLSQSKCLIITSTLESFCLPLHEAMYFKLDLIAGNYQFITEYTKPTISLSEISSTKIKEALLLYSSP